MDCLQWISNEISRDLIEMNLWSLKIRSFNAIWAYAVFTVVPAQVCPDTEEGEFHAQRLMIRYFLFVPKTWWQRVQMCSTQAKCIVLYEIQAWLQTSGQQSSSIFPSSFIRLGIMFENTKKKLLNPIPGMSLTSSPRKEYWLYATIQIAQFIAKRS